MSEWTATERELVDRESRELAELACADHHQRMVRNGESPDEAVSYIVAKADPATGKAARRAA